MSDWYPSGSEDSFFSSTETSEEENEEVQPSIHPDYMDLMDSGDDSTEEKRVIKSAKAKRWEELKKITKNLQAKKSINDWTALFEEWNAVLKCMDKAKGVIREHGLPRFLIATFLQLEDFIAETGDKKELLKNMKKQNSQSFNTVKQRFRKYLETEEYNIRAKMSEWRESGKEYDGEDFEEDDEEETKGDGLWSSEEEDETPAEPSSQKKPTDLRDRDEKWTQEKVDLKIKEMLGKRGAKSYDKKQHYKDFVFLKEKSEGVNNKLAVDFHILNILHDMIPATGAISLKLWTKTYNMLVSLLDQFSTDKELKLYETIGEYQAVFGADAEVTPLPANVVVGHLLHSLEKLGDEYTSALQATEAPSEQYLMWLSHENPLLRLYDYAKKYYMEKGDYKRASVVSQKIMYFISYRHETSEKGQPVRNLAESSSNVLEDEEGNTVASPDEVDEDVVLNPPASIKDDWNIEQLVPELCSFICQHHPEDAEKRSAILELVYHYAIHDKYFEARDLLLMTHLQEKIHQARPSLQVLFNRATVQLGLAAFRLGRINDAHNCLQELCYSQRIKELLAQGINVRFQGEKTKEQENSEQERQVPYHMHINLDLVEFVHLVCAMLLEVPNTAQTQDRDQRRKIVSKHFVKIMEYYDRQIFTGTPESARETILVAAKSLEKGDWKNCKDLILSLPVLQLFPNKDAIVELLGKEIQEQGLRTYLFAYGQYYDSLSLDQLSLMFELDQNVAHSIISKMIVSEELAASWDQPTGALLIHTQDPTPLQLQALNYADKINILLESVDGSDQRGFDRRLAMQATTQPQGQAQQKKPTSPVVTGTTAPTAQRKPVATASKLATSSDRGFTTRDRRAKKANAFNKK